MNKNVSAAIRSLRDGLVKFVNCGEFNVTKELHAEINGITSALDSLKLDYMFLSNSRSWRNQFNQDALRMDQAEILNLMERGEAMLRELTMHLGKNLATTLQENQSRKIHFIAKEKLRFFLKSIHPFSQGAYVRLINYTMDAGLKDRYATIKNELLARTQEPQEPLKAWIEWTDRTFPEQPGFKTPDWRDHTYGLRHDDAASRRYENKSSGTNKNESGFYFMNSTKYNFPSQASVNRVDETTDEKNRRIQAQSVLSVADIKRKTANQSVLSSYEKNRMSQMSMMAPPSSYGTCETVQISNVHNHNWKKHATEAGINLNVPGKTEHQYKYQKPVKPNYKNFVVNPQQDTMLLRRPFLLADYDAITTEYRQRFMFPDKNKIDKFPWIK